MVPSMRRKECPQPQRDLNPLPDRGNIEFLIAACGWKCLDLVHVGHRCPSGNRRRAASASLEAGQPELTSAGIEFVLVAKDELYNRRATGFRNARFTEALVLFLLHLREHPRNERWGVKLPAKFIRAAL